MPKMMVVLDFRFKVSIISEKQFKLEKKQEVMPFVSIDYFHIFKIKFAHLLVKRAFLKVVFYAEHDSVVIF